MSLEGRRLVRALGNKLKLTEDLTAGHIVTSSNAAAVQTAELFADRIDYVGIIEVLPALAGSVPPELIAPGILARDVTTVIVADEPALSNLGAFLVGRPTFPPLNHAQVSVIRDRQPLWIMRASELVRGQLLLA